MRRELGHDIHSVPVETLSGGGSGAVEGPAGRVDGQAAFGAFEHAVTVRASWAGVYWTEG
jgi:hypothetical protein